MFGLWGGASFFLLSMLITFPRFNRPRGETSRGIGAVVPGFEPDLRILFLRPGSLSRFGGRYKLAPSAVQLLFDDDETDATLPESEVPTPTAR